MLYWFIFSAGVPLDIYCTYYTPDGVYGSIYYDLPEYLDCLPSSADFAEVCDPFYFQDYNSGLSGAESDIEQGFFDSGYTFVQCEVGTPDRGGDDDVLPLFHDLLDLRKGGAVVVAMNGGMFEEFSLGNHRLEFIP